MSITSKEVEKDRETKSVIIWVLAYILMSFTITWSIWLVCHNISQLQAIGLYLGMFGPAISALIMRGVAGEGLKDSGIQFHLKQRKQYYFLAYLVIPLLLLLGLLFAVGIGALQLSRFMPIQLLQEVLLVFVLLPIPASLLAFGEELGWRGYLFPTLAFLGTRRAAIITGVVWTCWHTPLLLGYTFSNFQHAWIGIPFYALLLLPVGIFLAWLKVRSASIWPSTLGHGMFNAFQFFIYFLLSIHTLPDLASVGWIVGTLPLLLCAGYLLLKGKYWSVSAPAEAIAGNVR